MPYINKIFDATSDSTSMRIIRTVASINKNIDGIESKEIIREANVDSRLYYQRVSKLLKTDLIKKRDDKYLLTRLGEEVYSSIRIIDEALSIIWKLKVIDILVSSYNSTKDEMNHIVDYLIDNDEIKNILKKSIIITYHTRLLIRKIVKLVEQTIKGIMMPTAILIDTKSKISFVFGFKIINYVSFIGVF